MIQQKIKEAIESADVIGCESAEIAIKEMEQGGVDLVSTALLLPDMDGMALCAKLRDITDKRYIPMIVVSGDVTQRLVDRGITADVTDYFDKSDGFTALGAFLDSYVRPAENLSGNILYVEDSRVVAVATLRMMKKHGLTITHLVTVEEAIEVIEKKRHETNSPGFDMVLTDVYLKGGLEGSDLVKKIRKDFAYSKGDLPVIVLTGDDNLKNQSALLAAGANDLVGKPIDEQALIPKLRFQIRLSQQHNKHTASN